MPNPYFQFKRFKIYQDQCALKVCTDACILGAWFAERIPSSSKVLDIGSGTGLLMLQIAQKHEGEIHGIELDPDAFGQGKENIGRTEWSDRLSVFHGDARTFAFPGQYDFIITNPPFFESDLGASSGPKNLAKHSKELTLAELMDVIDANLKRSGSFGILLPYHRAKYFEELATRYHFLLLERLLVRQTPRHDYFRAILHFSKALPRNSPGPSYLSTDQAAILPDTSFIIQDTSLIIKENKGQYTEEFVALLKDYYLYL
jgi:tRNA1Val (adenine37-N6)-methyltransferase